MLNQLTAYRIQNGNLIVSTDVIDFSAPPVYEVIRLLDGVPMFFEGHMDRMFQSLEMIGEHEKITKIAVLNSITVLVSQTGIKDNNIRIEVGRDQDSCFVWTLYFVNSYYPSEKEYGRGVKTVSYAVERKNPHAKIFRSEFVQKINQLKSERQAYEVILINDGGYVTEGSRSNLFFVKENCIYTAKTKDVLQGITRKKIMEVIDDLKIEIIEKDIAYHDLANYEACFLSGTSINVLPIASIDEVNYASPAHPILVQVLESLKDVIQNDIEKTRRLIHD